MRLIIYCCFILIKIISIMNWLREYHFEVLLFDVRRNRKGINIGLRCGSYPIFVILVFGLNWILKLVMSCLLPSLGWPLLSGFLFFLLRHCSGQGGWCWRWDPKLIFRQETWVLSFIWVRFHRPSCWYDNEWQLYWSYFYYFSLIFFWR